MRMLSTVALAAVVAVVVACSSEPERPARTVNCAGSQPTPAVGDSGLSCPGICLPSKDPCTDVETTTDAGAGAGDMCPTGYVFPPNRFTCAGGASCCVLLAQEAGPTDAAPDAPADASSE